MFQKLNFPDFSIDVESLVAEVRNFNGHFSVVHVFGWQSKKVFTKIRKIDLFIPSCHDSEAFPETFSNACK